MLLCKISDLLHSKKNIQLSDLGPGPHVYGNERPSSVVHFMNVDGLTCSYDQHRYGESYLSITVGIVV